MLQWFVDHAIGWEIFVPAVLLYATVAAVLERRGHGALVPYVFLVCWVGAMVAAYGVNHVHAMRLRNVGLWEAMSLTIVLITLIPLAFTQIGASLVGRLRRDSLRWLVGGAIALALLPITNLVSGQIADVVLPRLMR